MNSVLMQGFCATVTLTDQGWFGIENITALFNADCLLKPLSSENSCIKSAVSLILQLFVTFF